MTDTGPAFDALMGTLDYPMFIVTARDGDRRAGCLIGFATQACIHPRRFLACLSDKNQTYRVARGAEHLAVHFVPAGAGELAELFGGETGDETDKFARAAWHDGPEGLPILDDCENWFAGHVIDRFTLGDHVGFLLEPVAVHHGSAGQVFTFHRAKRIEPGHEA
jgi:flavin reductase (DIM6/NTAB) family NADH-FMN oxidoreductase RutF